MEEYPIMQPIKFNGKACVSTVYSHSGVEEMDIGVVFMRHWTTLSPRAFFNESVDLEPWTSLDIQWTLGQPRYV
ncbi:unnamed protein product [Dovyalis caffra]|uniref:Uncharacterized protein n=1 Tax=Dovyalis caffra TaxID=77055 RepID=A0AAV1RRK1_9ROSI|nr:unnamed protein product [Dovyalis caffra]